MAGMRVCAIRVTPSGDIDMAHLKEKVRRILDSKINYVLHKHVSCLRQLTTIIEFLNTLKILLVHDLTRNRLRAAIITQLVLNITYIVLYLYRLSSSLCICETLKQVLYISSVLFQTLV